MTRLAPPPPQQQESPSLDDVQHLLLENISWDLYEKLLREVGDRPLRMTYDNGRLEIMSPLPEHEDVKILIHDLIRALTEELNITVKSLGSTTFRRQDLAKGLEPDQCYYFKHEAKMRGRKRINLKKDPAPELAIEIDITSASLPRQPVYAALGVNEIWRYDGKTLECLELANNQYRPRKTSRIFPALTVSDLTKFIKQLPTHDENSIIRAFRQWVRSTLCNK